MNENETLILRAMKALKPNKYGVVIQLGINPGDQSTGSITINRRDFAIRRLQHCVQGEDGNDPEQYTIDFSLHNDERFYKGDEAPMAGIYGSTHTGIWNDFEPPVQVEEQTTLYLRVTNRYAAALGAPINIQIWLDGAELRKTNK